VRPAGAGAGAGADVTALSDQTKATTQPINVHPAKRFKADMATAEGCCLLLAIISGKKYRATPMASMRNIPTDSTQPPCNEPLTGNRCEPEYCHS